MAELVSFRKCCCFEWKVKNLYSVDRLESPVFSFNGSHWRLRLQKAGNGDLLVYFDGINSKHTRFRDTWIYKSVFIKDVYLKHQFSSSYDQWTSEYPVWENPLIKLQEEETELLKKGVVTFVCILILPNSSDDANDTGDKCAEELSQPDPEECIEKLSEDLRRLLEDDTHCDVTLKCGDITIPAHRNILTIRSEVFAAMLRNDMIEKRSGLVEISDVDSDTLKQMVEFMYCGKLSGLSLSSALPLYVAADKYAIGTLKTHCSLFIWQNLTQEYACTVVALADALCDKNLKECAISLIIKKELMLTDMWAQFSENHTKLANEILIRAYKASKNIK